MAQDEASSELETLVLSYLHEHGAIPNSVVFAQEKRVQHDDVVNVLKSLVGSEYVVVQTRDEEGFILTEEGKHSLAEGTPEARVYKAIGDAGLPVAELEERLTKEVTKHGLAAAMKQKWVTMEKATGLVKRVAAAIQDEVSTLLGNVQSGTPVDAKKLADLKKRKLVAPFKIKIYQVEKGPKFKLERKKLATDLDAEMLKGSWEQEEFKAYNFKAQGPGIAHGCLHPLMKIRHEVRSILLQMGFHEMPTNNFVESSFWNFDSLFQPQQHPARDAHDTFFLSAPAATTQVPPDYLQRVRDVHEQGGYGSIGYRYPWKLEESQKNILRTHTTAVSSRMLYLLANQAEFKPMRYFSIDRVFRNESLDATHLAEFHQVEGLIADRGLTLGDLIGTIQHFFQRIGISDVRFKPAYNPYTEPSMEVFGYSVQLKRWIEVGNSGMFRPEMLRPMGLPEDVRVIAWGLSLERPTMIKYGIKNIRDLFGPKVKLDIIHQNPIARYF